MSRIELGAEGDVLTRDECLHHLASGSVGRVSMSSRALPSVLPVQVPRRR